jgi:beta-lactamase regulating signal transducer with metallopeptidase domain
MMTNLEALSRFIVTTLFSGLWQAPLFAVVAWFVLRLQPRANATTRHSVFAAALLAGLTVPLVTAGLSMTHVSNVSNESIETTDVPVPKHLLPYHPPKIDSSVRTRTNTDVARRSGPVLATPLLPRVKLALPKSFALAIVAVWSIGASVVLVRLIVSLAYLERLKRDALPLPVEYRERLTRWAGAGKGSRNVRLCTSAEIEVPIAVGLFDAMILVPNRLLEELEPHDVDSIVLHELAHLRRSDDWINAIERFGYALLFFNPGIAWLVSQLDLEREVACDDWVLQQNDALPYATCLAKVVESTVWPYRAMTAPGAFVTRRGMSIRIERLLAKHRDVRVRTSFGPAGGTVAVLAALGLIAALVSPSIAYSVALPSVPVAAPAPPQPKIIARALPSSAAVTVPRVAPHVIARPSAPRAPHTLALARPMLRPAPLPVPHALPRALVHTEAVVVENGARVSVWATDDSKPPETPRVPNVPSANQALVVADATQPHYIDELAGAGYTGLSVDDLIQLKSIGVTADFIRELQREGLGHPSVADLVKLRSLDIDAKFVGAMRRRYGSSLSIDDIASMRALGVTREYVDELAAAGLKDLSADNVRSLRALGITPAYIRELARAGYGNLSAAQLQQLRALGIDRDFIERANSRGLHGLSVQQLMSLKATGVL